MKAGQILDTVYLDQDIRIDQLREKQKKVNLYDGNYMFLFVSGDMKQLENRNVLDIRSQKGVISLLIE